MLYVREHDLLNVPRYQPSTSGLMKLASHMHRLTMILVRSYVLKMMIVFAMPRTV